MHSIEAAIGHAAHRVTQFFPRRGKDFWLFESAVWLHIVGASVISIYIPILMLQAGFALSAVFFFLVLFHLVSGVVTFAVRPFIRIFDARLSIGLATGLFIIFLGLYSSISLTQELWQLIALGVLSGLYDAFYFTPLFYIFIGSNSEQENTGENTGILNLVIKSAALLGPIVGSSLILFFNSDIYALAVASIILLVSLIPLYRIQSIETRPESNPPKFLAFFSDPREKKNYVSLVFFKIHEAAEAMLWPIFIFTVFNTLESIAGLAVLVSVLALLFSYLAGHIKEAQRERVIIIGSLLLALVWTLRVFIEQDLVLYATVIATSLFILMVKIPLEANIFQRGSVHAPLTSSMYKNAFGMLGKGLFFLAVSLSGINFDLAFVVLAVLMLGIALANYIYLRWRKHHELPLTKSEGRTTEPLKPVQL